jgi:transcriptional regulator with XRE-family HTH domain
MTFADTLTRLRERAGLTQEQLAERSSFSRGYIAQLESGYRGERVKRATANRLAHALDVDVGELLTAAQLRLSAADIPPESRPDFVDFLLTEPTLTISQRRMMAVIYRAFVEESQSGEASAPKTR